MDHMKQALKHKMSKAVTVKIQIGHDGKDDPESEKTSDMAPVVKDSQEPGVEKGMSAAMPSLTDNIPGEGPGPEGSPMHEKAESPAFEQAEQALHPVAAALMKSTPSTHPAGGKTLDSIAHERMLKRMHAKNSLKV